LRVNQASLVAPPYREHKLFSCSSPPSQRTVNVKNQRYYNSINVVLTSSRQVGCQPYNVFKYLMSNVNHDYKARREAQVVS
jgi:hypothetical protein